jgi:hypothetical protein
MGIGLHWSNNLSGLILAGTQGDVLKSVAPLQFSTPGLVASTAITWGQCAIAVLILTVMIQRREAVAATRAQGRDGN